MKKKWILVTAALAALAAGGCFFTATGQGDTKTSMLSGGVPLEMVYIEPEVTLLNLLTVLYAIEMHPVDFRVTL